MGLGFECGHGITMDDARRVTVIVRHARQSG